jgi:hypothetical protein
LIEIRSNLRCWTEYWKIRLGLGTTVSTVVGSDKAGVADPPQAETTSMTVIMDKEKKEPTYVGP